MHNSDRENAFDVEYKALRHRFDVEVRKLRFDYAMAASDVSVGDTINGRDHSIVVDAITISHGNYPQCEYYGYIVGGIGTRTRIIHFNIKKIKPLH